jgi:hypothetical protein
LPTSLDGRDGEFSRIAVYANGHTCFVSVDIINSMGNSFLHWTVGEIVRLNRNRILLATVGFAHVLEFSYDFFLFRIDRNGGLLISLYGVDSRRDEFEWRIAVGM